ncbi:chaperone NapD [Bosea lathyri]|jgi:nitrate reductase NapD|uniref:Chaperone NapD n=1 Tax=Bosea lathyri TaxID=1036778 RepID=A0A1H6ANI8_9HYPH|nr:chaperone NapD [Bosea lathyri]SEG49760.1 periplasmic nitrate reductase chaperone NapD [Bosea lathyri]
MTARDGEIDRRDFIRGRIAPGAPPDRDRPGGLLYIASAVVTARAEDCAEVARHIAAMPGTEVHAINGTKIIVVIESEDSGEIGSRLTEMALLDRVFSANLVFEQIEPLDPPGVG